MRKYIYLIAFCLPFCLKAQRAVTDSVKVPSGIFGDERIVRVYLPKEYSDNAWRKYPVIYLFDGQSDELFEFTQSTIDYITGFGYMPPVILVAVPHHNRQFELTPAATTATGKKQFSKSGGADSLALYLQTEVTPIIKKKYRCSNYAIGIGHSLGGTFVLHSLLGKAPLFNAGIAVSPNVFYDSLQIVRAYEQAPRHQLEHKFIYICYGSGDALEDKFRPSTKQLRDVLLKNKISGLHWQSDSFPGLDHGVTPLNGIPSGLIALFRPLSLSYEKMQSFLQDSSRSFISQYKEYYQPLAEWSGLILPGVNDANTQAYNLFYTGRTREAIAVLEWAIALHPQEVNLYDSMGEMQQARHDRDAALRYYRKGLSLVHSFEKQLSPEIYQQKVKWFNERLNAVK